MNPENQKKQTSISTQTDSNLSLFTSRKVDLLVENQHLKQKLRKKDKSNKLLKQKVHKLHYFLLKLQEDHSIPVNQLYEAEGIRQIPTDRFDELMV